MALGIVLAAFGFGTLVLEAFGGGKILYIDIPTLVPLVFLLSLSCYCLCSDDNKSEHAHNRNNIGGGER